jgi:hypothetical protein
MRTNELPIEKPRLTRSEFDPGSAQPYRWVCQWMGYTWVDYTAEQAYQRFKNFYDSCSEDEDDEETCCGR